MTYRRIIAEAGTEPDTVTRLVYASGLADKFGAELAGLFVRNPVELPPLVGEAGVIGARSVIEGQQEQEDAKQGQSEGIFDQLTGSTNGQDNKFLSVEGFDGLLQASATSDLLVCGGPDADGSWGLHDLGSIRKLTKAAGIPVILLPAVENHDVPPTKFLIAWDNSSEAARALKDSLPLLRDAEDVRAVILIDDVPGQNQWADDVATRLQSYLALHDVEVLPTVETTKQQSKAERLQEHIAEFRPHVLVMGASDPSVWDWLTGSMTREAINKFELPLLLSH